MTAKLCICCKRKMRSRKATNQRCYFCRCGNCSRCTVQRSAGHGMASVRTIWALAQRARLGLPLHPDRRVDR